MEWNENITIENWEESKRKSIRITGLSLKDRLRLCWGVFFEHKIIFNSAKEINRSTKFLQEQTK